MLRALEPTDIDFLYQLENERGLWEVSETQLPFARHLLQQYLLNATQDIYEARLCCGQKSYKSTQPTGVSSSAAITNLNCLAS